MQGSTHVEAKNASALALLSVVTADQQTERAFANARRAMDRDVPVVLVGETGTGKELFARALHISGSRSDHPFVAMNCAALPESLIEGELFGYGDGAFTGAKRGGAAGRIESADGGTLFLDEIGDMPLSLQTRLLRILQERAVVRLGGRVGSDRSTSRWRAPQTRTCGTWSRGACSGRTCTIASTAYE